MSMFPSSFAAALAAVAIHRCITEGGLLTEEHKPTKRPAVGVRFGGRAPCSTGLLLALGA
jgi:hypothetical protein